MNDDWNDELKRFDERTTKRRAKAKAQETKAQDMIREAEERREEDKTAE